MEQLPLATQYLHWRVYNFSGATEYHLNCGYLKCHAAPLIRWCWCVDGRETGACLRLIRYLALHFHLLSWLIRGRGYCSCQIRLNPNGGLLGTVQIGYVHLHHFNVLNIAWAWTSEDCSSTSGLRSFTATFCCRDVFNFFLTPPRLSVANSGTEIKHWRCSMLF